MTNIYVNSGNGTTTGYYAVATWAAATAYLSTANGGRGDYVRQLAAPGAANERVFRCTVSGTTAATEPVWVLTQNATTTDNTATWTECTGQEGVWAVPHSRLANAAGIDVAGDTLYLSQAHSETTAAAQAIALAGTAASPTRIIAGNDAAAPPTAVSTAQIATTGAFGFTFTGSCYVYGLTVLNGTGASNANLSINITTGGNVETFDTCSLRLGQTSAVGRIIVGNNASAALSISQFYNTTFSFAHVSQHLQLTGKVHIRGGGLLSGTSAINQLLLTPGSRPIDALIEDFDMVNGAAAMNLVQGGAGDSGRVVFRNCKLPVGWGTSGTLLSPALTTVSLRAEMYNCAEGDTNYALWIEDYYGSIRDEIVIVRTAGASDGTTQLSWKMVSSANTTYPSGVLKSPEMVIWNDTPLVSKTVTVRLVHDSLTALTDGEVWLEVEYLGNLNSSLGVHINDAKANVLATAVAQTVSTAAWTTTGLVNPNKQKLVTATFTPQEKGFFLARVCLAKPNTTIYVDPKLEV